MEETSKMIALPFDFKNREYCSLIRIKQVPDGQEFHVTVMNGDLERALYGHHIFVLENGVLQASSIAEDQDLCLLQEKLAWEILNHVSQQHQEPSST